MKQFASFFVLMALSLLPLSSFQQKPPPESRPKTTLLKLLDITPSPDSIDFIQNKTLFFLQNILTEQSHPKTRNFSQLIREDPKKGMSQILVSYEDIIKTLEAVAKETLVLNSLVRAIEKAILTGHKIYIYSSSANSLAKQVESDYWRPFWKRARERENIWKKLNASISENIPDRLIGEMTGGDRALMGSMEGLDDLLLIGWFQLQEHSIKKEDMVICFSEGGDTPSVIGTLQAAVDLWKTETSYDPQEAQKHLYFIYNNPDEELFSIDRSQSIIENSGITKINLSTGPQSISGSTRMQATAINAFFFGHVLQSALHRTLKNFLSKKEMAQLGFQDNFSLTEKLSEFSTILKEIKNNLPALERISQLEYNTYKTGHSITCFAQKGLLVALSDITEMSLDFSFPPLDSNKEINRRSWIQVWTAASGLEESWQALLGRDFRGLDPVHYKAPFSEVLADPRVKKMALDHLKNTGDNQKLLYDFSLASFNLTNRGPRTGDLGVCVLMDLEDAALYDKSSYLRRFLSLFSGNSKNSAILFVHSQPESNISRHIASLPESEKITRDAFVSVFVGSTNDPFAVNQQTGLKILLTTLSTAVMADLERITGNTLTHVRPSSLKFIGRATYLIQSHVNDTLSHSGWIKPYGIRNPISFGEANAVLFESMRYLKDKDSWNEWGSEVALSIIQILESLRQKTGLIQDEAYEIMKNKGLAFYLSEIINK
ncbi:MAG: hypothetical protein MUP98_03880 [Candidatus Aminicenantes bacterium]|nr:hypothetical protein [Candidatus Aminicenantes bacterium]